MEATAVVTVAIEEDEVDEVGGLAVTAAATEPGIRIVCVPPKSQSPS